MIEIGTSIGRYHILERLGEGGMAIVYKAYDTRLERDVALKVIRVDAFPPAILERVLKRFEREALSLARLSHPNIVKVFDFGEHAGAPYLVMEFIPGGTLKQLTGRPMPWKKAGLLLIPIAQALDYAHQKGVVHRDVKPANIMMAEQGQPMLTDFGIARLLEEGGGATLTGTGVGIGTPEYMAPEQGMGRPTDGRADVYSLGIVYYELITGCKPFSADTPMAVVFKQMTDPLPPPGKYTPGIPAAVEKFLFKALAKQPEDRFDNMHSLSSALSSLTMDTPPISETLTEAFAQLKPAEKVRVDGEETGEETFDLGVTPPSVAARPDTIRETPPPDRPSVDHRKMAAQPEPVIEKTEVPPQQPEVAKNPPEIKSEKAKVEPHYSIGKAVKIDISHWIVEWTKLLQPSITWLKRMAKNRFSWVWLGVVLLSLFAIVLVNASSSNQRANAYIGTKITTLYLTSNRDDSRQIYSQNQADGTLIRITDPQKGECFTPAVVRDGLLYATCVRNGRMGIYSQDPSSGIFTPVTQTASGNCWEPAIGPFENLYFTCDREGKREIYSQDSQTGAVYRITDLAQGESWDPALGLNNDLYFTSDRDGSTQIYHQSSKTGIVERVTDPEKGWCWSPHLGSNNVLFFNCHRDGSTQIYSMDYATGEVFRVTDSSVGENWDLIPGPNNYLYLTSNRDGKREAYSMDSQTGVVNRVTNTNGNGESWTSED